MDVAILANYMFITHSRRVEQFVESRVCRGYVFFSLAKWPLKRLCLWLQDNKTGEIKRWTN